MLYYNPFPSPPSTPPPALSTQPSVYMAKLAEQAERYDEMVSFMKDVAKVSYNDVGFGDV